ncbi:UGT1 [Coprinopsis cinerea okayama7|uniref:UGT1 n=1 Tax=Coprinopsis cinerea (strain Okayama-7 / 130 / ATCC MYA-4618 / FGSC 9003) TaxID=240176 RepID=A8NED6_COPC7|nr:UGT1 [Coprinopsis cinerea okayama7\|eukprot:XP_001832998.1 UGT1 [Coprinopsis cinerea okayama7\
MYQRPQPTVRTKTGSMSTSSPRVSPLLPSAAVAYSEKHGYGPTANGATPQLDNQAMPTILGMPLKYVSLVTLAVQNASLSIVMHYSRVSTPAHLAYSPASAVLFNEILKGTISFFMAVSNSPLLKDNPSTRQTHRSLSSYVRLWLSAVQDVWAEILSPDCWKLSIPAILYVIQNSLQFVAISNLPVATFQVTYQMKILTTAAFSVALLRKKLSGVKWLSLFFLAVGVGIVQIQSTGSSRSSGSHGVGSAHEFHAHVMNPWKGFGAVTAACFTSGLAGVYFEMVLKNSKADLWVRNVQLSLFSLIPALLPILYAPTPVGSRGFILDLFRNFGPWAWATVAIQVLGGLITAIVIKYSDNIMKGFATSLSIVLSFLASVILFDFKITFSFLIGATTVLCATWMYNQPAGKEPKFSLTGNSTASPIIQKAPLSSPIIGETGFSRKSGGGKRSHSRGNSISTATPMLNQAEGYFGDSATVDSGLIGGSPLAGTRAGSPRYSLIGKS